MGCSYLRIEILWAPHVLTVFQIGLQHLTSDMKESFYG